MRDRPQQYLALHCCSRALWAGLVGLAAFAGSAFAQHTADPAPFEAPASSVLIRQDTPRTASPPAAKPAQASPPGSAVQVVELPAEGGPLSAKRKHHALSFQTPAISRTLNQWGLEGADCSTRLRLPSKLRQSRQGGVDVNIEAQIALSCRF
jgi:hypothetical protein